MAAKRSTKKTSTRSSSRGKKPAAKKKAATKKRTAKKGPAKKGPASKARSKKAGTSAAADRVSLVQEIIDVMEARGAVEVEFKDGDFKLRVRRREEHPPTAWAHAMPMPAAPVAAAPAAAPMPAAGGEAPAADDPDALPPGTEVFASPMVGTFYAAPQPDAEPFAKAGDRIGEDDVICIIEAMKVMNEIKAERSFEVVKVLAENGEPVEFGQPLFVIKA